MLSFLSHHLSKNRFFKVWFGDFEEEELKKFILLGMIFALVIGIYWTLRPLKDGIFMSIVNIPKHVKQDDKAASEFLPLAKILSLIVLFPLVMLYSKATEKFPRQYMFYALGTLYILASIAFGLYFWYSPNGLSNTVGSPYRYAGWMWYVFVESFGSLMVALFWAFASNTSTAESAKKGFALVVMLGQLGSIFGPKFLTPLGKQYFGNSAPVILICAGLLTLAILLVRHFMQSTPPDQLSGFHGTNEAKVEAKQETGFFEGLKLLLSKKYLLSIFGVISIYEIIVTIIDYNFKTLAAAQYPTEALRTEYFGNYAVWVNVVAFLCLLLGINNIQRYLGVKFSLALMPVIVSGLVVLFLMYNNLFILFPIMVAVKAINYSLNNPVMKQLYVPTTPDVKYKAQAWIETFGSRGAKSGASGFNYFSNYLGSYFILATSLISFGLIGFWFLIALYLGTTYQKAVNEKKVVC